MIQLKKYKTIFWDFDGVILDSMKIRDLGFEKTLASYPKEQVERLLKYHNLNGGLSRYVKFRYFFEEIRKEKITEEEIQQLASKFSSIMLDLLIDENLLINETVDFIKNNHKKYNFHIVSGSDGAELNKICKGLGIDKYFLSIQGSPTPKTTLVKNLIVKHSYNNLEVCLIGDSVNDAEAATDNKVDFFGYNNPKLTIKYKNYIYSFNEI